MPRRSPEQVHDEDGHPESVASCRRCATEAEHDRNAEQARAEIVEQALATGGVVTPDAPTVLGEDGPPPFVLPARPGECEVPDCSKPGTHHGRCCTHWRTR